jgi:hypothetical protein
MIQDLSIEMVELKKKMKIIMRLLKLEHPYTVRFMNFQIYFFGVETRLKVKEGKFVELSSSLKEKTVMIKSL